VARSISSTASPEMSMAARKRRRCSSFLWRSLMSRTVTCADGLPSKTMGAEEISTATVLPSRRR
jgi:hypothetical protein